MIKFYKYVSADVAKIIIKDGTLKFTSPVNFNDPFDYHPAVLNTGFSKFARRLNKDIGKGIKQYKTSHSASSKHLQSLRSGEFRETYTRDMSISCFSKSQYILPMWAHYADNHEGCVIEFQFDSKRYIASEYFLLDVTEPSKILLPFDVIYSINRPPLYDKEGRTNTSTTGFNACLTKAKEWEYEKELRVIIKKPEGIYSFERTQMTGLYFGMKMSSINKKELSRIVDGSNNYTDTKIRKHDVVMAYEKFELSKTPFRL